MLNKVEKVLRVGGNVNNPKDWEVCTIKDRVCQRHVHIEKIKTNSFSDLGLDKDASNDIKAESTDWKQAQKDKIDGLLKSIELGVDDIINSGEVENFLAHMSKFHNYSFSNKMLIYIQKPEATQVAGYNKWEEMGRQVKKGEQGISILAPVAIKGTRLNMQGEEEEYKFTRFREVRVFDKSQTEPALHEFANEAELNKFVSEWESKGYTLEVTKSPKFTAKITGEPESGVKLLKGQAPEPMKSFILGKISSEGIEIEYGNVSGGANGAAYKSGDKIKIQVRDDVDEAQQFKTLTHELMHVKLGHLDRMDDYHTGDGGHRGKMEVAVEALAFMVSNHFGLDTSDYSHGYMANWTRNNKDALKEVLEKDVSPFFKDFMKELPEIGALPMGTSASKRRKNKK
jgi:antirestriction protein ArdC